MGGKYRYNTCYKTFLRKQGKISQSLGQSRIGEMDLKRKNEGGKRPGFLNTPKFFFIVNGNGIQAISTS